LGWKPRRSSSADLRYYNLHRLTIRSRGALFALACIAELGVHPRHLIKDQPGFGRQPVLRKRRTMTEPARAPAVSGIRSRKRQCPLPVTPSAPSTKAPITIVISAAQANADQLDF